MLSRLAAGISLQRGLNKAFQQERHELQNVLFRRDHGHYQIDVRPTPWDARFSRNWIHFYFVLYTVPMAIITSIIALRANPELVEEPEGYKPLYWEYQKHPIQRFFAKYFFNPQEIEHEALIGLEQYVAEGRLLMKLSSEIDDVMKFYNDHRSRYFRPHFGGDYVRVGRDEWNSVIRETMCYPSKAYDQAYDPDLTVVPIESFQDGPIEK